MTYTIISLLIFNILTIASVAAVHASDGLEDPFVVGNFMMDLCSNAVAWTVTSADKSLVIPAIVPGDLLTDLELSGKIGDPLFNFNFKSTVWDEQRFSYTCSFDAVFAGAPTFLVFDAIKMAADIYLNNQLLGTAADQFLRYAFDVTELLRLSGNYLNISFHISNDTANNEGRYMACSGAWDWAPYSSTHSPSSSYTFSKGITKNVYLVGASATTINHVIVQTFYNGSYPTIPLNDTIAGGWTVKVGVSFISILSSSGTLVVAGSWGSGNISMTIKLSPGEKTVFINMLIEPALVHLWWPNGLGTQNLYTVDVTYICANETLRASRSVGFRTLALVTANDTIPEAIAGLDGSGNLTMRFKVNGASIWARGANQIPMEEMEGRQNAQAYIYMVKAAADAGYNILRVWGGGIFLPEVFYSLCDQLGILLYHDAMYGNSWFGGTTGIPQKTPMQDAEIRHQIRRLSHRPSIAIWDSCNECNPDLGVFTTFVAQTISEEDPSRPIWPACPSNGWSHGVDRLWGLPNGSPLGLVPRTGVNVKKTKSKTKASLYKTNTAPGINTSLCQIINNVNYSPGTMSPFANPVAVTFNDCCAACVGIPGCLVAVFFQGICFTKDVIQVKNPTWSLGTVAVWVAGSNPTLPENCNTALTLETHGYYQHGEGFLTVNSEATLDLFSANVPPALDAPAMLGINCPGTFASEFGASVVSSFESMSSTLNEEDWGLRSSPMFERNYASDNYLVVYFNVSWPGGLANSTGASNFQAQLYLAQVAQALLLKSDIETRRGRNSWGTINWQHNEIWPTGGWGNIEYGTVGFTPGQIIGGRWKPIMYFMKNHLFTDLCFACGAAGYCYVKNDNPFSAFHGQAVVTLLHVLDGAESILSTQAVYLSAGANSIQWLCAKTGGSPFSGTCLSLWPAIAAAGCAYNGSDCVLLLKLTSADDNNNVVYSNFELLAPPKGMILPNATVTASIQVPYPDGSIPILLACDMTAFFVGLVTQAQGRFSDNYVIMPYGTQTTIFFYPSDVNQLDWLTKTLRVDHIAKYFS